MAVSEQREHLFYDFPIGPGHQFSLAKEIYSHTEELPMISGCKLIVSESKITDLFKGKCKEPGCDNECQVKSKGIGCTQEIWWTCQNGHKGKWSSSEKYGGMYSNNLQFSVALLLSGNNYSKVELMTRFLSLSCLSEALFFRVQNFYCIPAIEEWWQWMQSNILSIIGNMEVIVSEYVQSDSPGHSAKYLTYFVHLECLDNREVGGKSPCMEKEALKHAIQQLKNLVNLKGVVTDASSSIKKVMGNMHA